MSLSSAHLRRPEPCPPTRWSGLSGPGPRTATAGAMPAVSAIDGENPVFNSVRIHTKLAMALVVPLAALVGLSALVVVVSGTAASGAGGAAEAGRARVGGGARVPAPAGLLNALQAERNGESMALLGIPRETMAQMMAAGDNS